MGLSDRYLTLESLGPHLSLTPTEVTLVRAPPSEAAVKMLKTAASVAQVKHILT